MKVKKYLYNPNKKGVFRVSVVSAPAVGNGDLVLCSEQQIKGIFYAPVMIPGVNIPRVDKETGEEYLAYYDADTVEMLAVNYFKQGGNTNTNIEHKEDNIDNVYPVESWIVKDPENDKSNALGMPKQKEGTWIMGYKCENEEVLKQIKEQLLNGLSIEGNLDIVEDNENPISKFNINIMSKTPLEFAKHIANVIMSAVSDEEKKTDGTVEEVKEEMALEPETDKTVEVEVETEKELSETEKELETAKATIAEQEKKISELEAKLATYENEATLMSSQLAEVNKAFESYKSVKMSAQKLSDTPIAKVEKPYEQMTNYEKAKYNRGKL